jgi:dTDP-4-dehydrorhamnose reductase
LKLLITGATGLLGSRLTQLAAAAGHEVHSAYHTRRPSQGTPLPLDINSKVDVEKAVRLNAPDALIHAAAITDVDLCELNPELAMRVNGTATGFLAQECRRVGSFMVYISTDYVFDGRQGQYKEDDQPNPINTYGLSKLHGEEQVRRIDGDFCIARTSVLYGWGRKERPNFATWIHENLRRVQRINVVTDQQVSPTLNTNLAKMLLEVTERRLKGPIHLAGATRLTRYEFATCLARRFDFDENLLTQVKSESISWRARRPWDSSLNVSRALEVLSNKPAPINAALDEFRREGTDR